VDERDWWSWQSASIEETKSKFFTLVRDLNFDENRSVYMMWFITSSSNFGALLSCIMRECQKRETFLT
jgi:hypothetical protein